MDEYTGYRELYLDDQSLNEVLPELYNHPDINTFSLLTNQYLVVYQVNEHDEENTSVCDSFKWNGQKLLRVPHVYTRNKFSGTTKARNIHQRLALDMLYDHSTTVNIIYGKYGTGKDRLMSAAALDMIERGVYESIVYVRNNIEVKDSKPIGHLPGSYREKLLPYAMPLADHLGGRDGIEMFFDQGKLEVIHLGFLRGRDIKNSIVYCSEAENMTKEHVQLLLGRIAEGSVLWMNGDFKQKDSRIFEINSGLATAIQKLKGHHLFSCVKLVKTERSETAAMADLLDD